jgi:hypothetical protein
MAQPGTVLVDPVQQPAYYAAPVEPSILVATQPVVHGAMPTPGYPGQAAEQPMQYYPVQAEPRQGFSPRLVYE